MEAIKKDMSKGQIMRGSWLNFRRAFSVARGHARQRDKAKWQRSKVLVYCINVNSILVL